jgi:hypothetical protein
VPRAKSKTPAPTLDVIGEFTNALRPEGTLPWDNITDFATHPSFCGLRLYPKQLTLLRLIYLETENMTAFDIDTIEKWREGWRDTEEPAGVQEDVWHRVEYLKARGYRHFPHVESLIGRRGSKGLIGGIMGTEKIAQMYSLDDWQSHYGVARGKDGYAAVVATSLNQAKKFQFADIRETMESCKYLERAIVVSKEQEIAIRTPADARRLAYMKSRGIPIDHVVASLHVVAMSSNSSSGRGATNFANFYDEFAHMISGTGSQKSSEEIYEAYQPSLDQFGKDSMTYIPTSPFTKVGRAYSLYKEGQVLMASYDPETGDQRLDMKTAKQLGTSRDEAAEQLVELTANPEMLVVQLPSWGLYEDYEKCRELGLPKKARPIQEYNERLMRLEKSNPEKFRVERRAQFASVMNAYLSPRKVEAMFKSWNGRTLGPVSRGRMDIKYRIHVDPSLSGANFAVCIAHTEEAPPDEHGEVWPHVVVDFLHVWRPQDFEDGFIDYVLVQQELEDLLRRFPSTTKFTSDQWNSAGFLAALRKEFSPRITVTEENFNEKSNQQRMERFKTALNLGWIHSYRDNFFDEEDGSLLEMELKFLQKKINGRVDKQDFGPVTTKDLADTVMAVSDDLLKDSLDRWQREMLSMNKTAVGSSNTAALRSGRDFERQHYASEVGTGPSPGWDSNRPMSAARQKLMEQSARKMRTRSSGGMGADYHTRLRGRRT